MADGDLNLQRTLPFLPGPLGCAAVAYTAADGHRYVLLTVETVTGHNLFFMEPDFAFQVVSRLNDAIRDARRPAIVRPASGIVIPKLNGNEPA